MQRKVVQLATLLLLTAAAGVLRADEIRLYDRAVVAGNEIHLGDIAMLRGSAAVKLDQLQVATIGDHESQTTVSLDDVRRVILNKRISLQNMAFAGFASCDVTRVEDQSNRPAPPVANPDAKVGLDSTMTLAHVVVRYLQDYTQYRSDELQIRFSRADEAALNRSALSLRFEIEPNTNAKLGRIPLTVRTWRDTQLLTTTRLTVYVSRKTLAATATRSISRGHVISSQDLQMAPIVITSDEDLPIVQLRSIVGRQASRSMEKGDPVFETDLQKQLLIERGDLVTVRCISGGVVVRITARAKDDGAMGDLVMVRNERSREEFVAKVVGQREMVISLDTLQKLAKGDSQ